MERYVADACERAGPVEVARGHPCGIKLVQVPTAPADDGGPFSNEVLAVIDQEADLAFDAVETGDGQIWFSQGGACDRKSVVVVQGRSVGGRSVIFVAEVLGRSKSVFTEIGPVQIDVPRDREGSFEPQIVKKRQRFLDGVDEVVLSLTARGLTTGEIAAHFDEVYGATVSKDIISRITKKVSPGNGRRGQQAP